MTGSRTKLKMTRKKLEKKYHGLVDLRLLPLLHGGRENGGQVGIVTAGKIRLSRSLRKDWRS
jgi:hypothetical protein